MQNDIELILDSFPSELEKEIKGIFNITSLKKEYVNNNTFDVLVNNQTLHIPERIYYEELDVKCMLLLSEKQKQIINCYFTRHHDGYTRQRMLINIFKCDYIDNWVIPYIIRLIGEYVVEIIDDIYKNINLIDKVELKKFILDNQKFILTTEGRIASYYGEYYRFNYKKEDYVGFKLKKYIKQLRECALKDIEFT